MIYSVAAVHVELLHIDSPMSQFSESLIVLM